MFDKLKDKLFISAEINEDNTVIKLTEKSGDLYYLMATGDCCSETWMENVTGTKDLLNNEILEVKGTDLGEAPGTRQDYDQKYSFIIKTKKGNFEIEYRNSSNGYYGGSMDLAIFSNDKWDSYYKPTGDEVYKELRDF
tara:strand:- start:3348 stop:3761 length:414 start_codon:yes stop_codon:yes gene_type:complete